MQLMDPEIERGLSFKKFENHLFIIFSVPFCHRNNDLNQFQLKKPN